MEDVEDGLVEALEALFAERGGGGAGVDLGGEECFIGIDVAEAAEKGLVEQEGFDAGLAAFGEGGEFVGGEIEGVWAAAGVIESPKHFAEFAYVVVAEGAFVEMDAGAGEFAGFGREEELAGHPEVDEQHAFGEIDDDELAVAADGGDGLADDVGRGDAFDRFDAAAGEYESEAADDGFDFGEFRQGGRSFRRGFRCRTS